MYEGSLDSSECRVMPTDVAEDSPRKGHQDSQGLENMMHKKQLKQVGLFHLQNRTLKAGRGNVNAIFTVRCFLEVHSKRMRGSRHAATREILIR